MTNTESDIRTARAELAGIIQSYDAGEYATFDSVAEALEHSLDCARVLLGLVDLSEEDEFEVTFDQNACTRCGLDVEAASDDPTVWRDRGGVRSCFGVTLPHTAEFRR